MSFLESIQHGLEKASAEASRLTKIQHLHNVANDLNFKISQEGQELVSKALELFKAGKLTEPELAAFAGAIVTQEQNLAEVQEEIQRLHSEQGEGEAAPIAAENPYAPSYPAYAPPPTGSPTSDEPPTKPGAPAPDEPPTQPGAGAPAVENVAPAEHVVHHHAAHKPAETETPATSETPQAPQAPATPADGDARGSYQQGALPPVFSPFASTPAATAEATPAATATEEKPVVHHHKKATEETPAATETK